MTIIKQAKNNISDKVAPAIDPATDPNSQYDTRYVIHTFPFVTPSRGLRLIDRTIMRICSIIEAQNMSFNVNDEESLKI